MRWRHDRGGHGSLDIRHDQRLLRRVHPVYRQLRTKRRSMLRQRWKDFAALVGLLTAVCACLIWPDPGQVQLRGFLVGTCAGLGAALIAAVALILNGSLLRRIGLNIEADIGNGLRRTPEVYGVVSSLMFERCDVDHVVLAPTGIWVLEVKWSMHPAADLDAVRGLPAHLQQVRAGTRKVTGLLRTVAPGVPVHPVLVLAGPGMPRVAAGEQRGGVQVVEATSPRGWAQRSPVGERSPGTCRTHERLLPCWCGYGTHGWPTSWHRSHRRPRLW